MRLKFGGLGVNGMRAVLSRCQLINVFEDGMPVLQTGLEIGGNWDQIPFFLRQPLQSILQKSQMR